MESRGACPAASGLFGLALTAGLLSAASGCIVPKPTARDVLETTQVVGFRDPEQTFETFRMAFRGNLTQLEYRCFSAAYKARNKLSPLVYREHRDALLGQTPFLRWGLYKAQITEIQELSERHARILACVKGRTLVLDFVREEYWELWAGRELLADDLVDDLYRRYIANVVTDEDGRPVFLGQIPLDGVDSERITEVRLGQEWKIDDFAVHDEGPPAPPAPD